MFAGFVFLAITTVFLDLEAPTKTEASEIGLRPLYDGVEISYNHDFDVDIERMWSDTEKYFKEWCYNDCCNFKTVSRPCKFDTTLVWTDEKCGYDDYSKRDKYKHFC